MHHLPFLVYEHGLLGEKYNFINEVTLAVQKE